VTAVGVLGPLLLRGPDGPIRLGSARQRRLLAALVAHLGAAVGTELLAELIWGAAGGDPPADPAGAVQTNVARLRRLLPPEIRIATTPEGYQLLADRAAVDVTAFTDHVAAAATMTDPQRRLHELAAALALWRGRPYAELDHPSLLPEVARLTELHAGAAEQYAAVLLAVGRTAEAVAACEALTVAEPLREGAVALLMRALVAAGRQSDALAAFGALRTRLADELGLDPAPELRALEQQVLRQEIPAPGPPAVPARTPAPRLPVSSFVGRADDLAAAAELLGRCRVVTLCGPGGVGKTRLAAHVAADVAGRYDDGVLLVELGEGGPADVQPALAAALRLSDDGRAGADSFADRIVEVLAVRRQLLVLDNCEHVADEVAALVEAITVNASGVDLLLTSREPLRVDGEHVLGIDPLEPAAAAELLTDRIRAGDPAAVPGPAQAGLVAELCRRLDGLPLALELAAARAMPLGLRGLLDALEQPFEVLRGGRRTASARHRSLRDVVEWSFGLLDDEQRALFERIAVFAGPVEHTAVVAVCGDARVLPDLVDRSLVVRHIGEPTRFGMLETLRAFGRSRLAADPAAGRLRARHAAWALRLADDVTAERRGPGEAAAVRRFDAHLADLRRAHAWLCEAGPLEDLLRLTVPFGELAYLRGRIDLVQLVERTLQVAGALGSGGGEASGSSHPLVARLLGLLATSSWQRGDLAVAESQARQAIAAAGTAGEPTAASGGYEAVGSVLAFRGDLAGAVRYAARSLELAEAGGDIESQLLPLVELVVDSAYAGDDDAAARHESTLADRAAQLGSPTARGFLAYVGGERRAERGDPDAARYLEAAIRAAEEVDSGFVAGIARHTLLTSTARGSRDPAAALAAFGSLIDHWHGFGAWTQLWIAVRALIETLSRLGRHGDVAVLLGALEASPRAPRAFGADSARADAVARGARTALGPAFETLRAKGAALGDQEAVALARRLTRASAGLH
jgi:predicted ATPase/DNA-binding SARP family transcriptional activator